MKQDRIELRASQKERERLLEAATFTGMSLSAFLRQAALEKSQVVLKSRDILTLSDRDRDLFLNALENPPEANKRLRQAFKNYQKRKSGISASSSVVKSKLSTKKKKTPKE
jgi:uncharacterized protein (DUF1778 family)